MESLAVLDQYKLNFNAGGLHVLNISLAIIMFGIALGIDMSNFKAIISKPKAFILGVISQFILLPAVTFVLVYFLKPTESVALGMILVAACPGGNVSNFITSLAKGNVELSLTLTGTSTLLSVIMTPINFAFWGSLYVNQTALPYPIEIDFSQMFITVVLILGLPLILGILFSKKLPLLTAKIKRPIKIASIIIFIGFIVVALTNNFNLFLRFIHLFFLLVLVHNLLALSTGYLLAKSFKLPKMDRKTISIETGIQNSGLALVLIFNPKIFPAELEIGGMAFIAAWWGIWHIISGLGIAFFWGRKA
jgi:BASS family bile acid:Na+ symporter